jgi:hypothetical protein
VHFLHEDVLIEVLQVGHQLHKINRCLGHHVLVPTRLQYF